MDRVRFFMVKLASPVPAPGETLVLGIDTASTSVSVALSNGRPARQGGIIGVQTLSVGPRHAETLLPAIEFLCRQIGVHLSTITHLVVDRGPGLFTGLRVGVATARTLAFALDLPLFGATSLEAIAHEGGRDGELVVPVLDARRSEVYSAVFRCIDGHLETILEPMVGVPSELGAAVAAAIDPYVECSLRIIGDGLLAHPEAFSMLTARPGVSFGPPLNPSAVGLIDAVLPRLAAAPIGDEGEIAYLRAPDAQITWENRHGRAE
jgi:tRNA threonylcarbamoyladenosine biosynthesis protein TsaB